MCEKDKEPYDQTKRKTDDRYFNNRRREREKRERNPRPTTKKHHRQAYERHRDRPERLRESQTPEPSRATTASKQQACVGNYTCGRHKRQASPQRAPRRANRLYICERPTRQSNARNNKRQANQPAGTTRGPGEAGTLRRGVHSQSSAQALRVDQLHAAGTADNTRQDNAHMPPGIKTHKEVRDKPLGHRRGTHLSAGPAIGRPKPQKPPKAASSRS